MVCSTDSWREILCNPPSNLSIGKKRVTLERVSLTVLVTTWGAHPSLIATTQQIAIASWLAKIVAVCADFQDALLSLLSKYRKVRLGRPHSHWED